VDALLGEQSLDPALLRSFAIALGLGLLVGLQRERAAVPVAGIRTFALVTWLGAVGAVLSSSAGPWLLAVGALGVVALAVGGQAAQGRNGDADPGITTEVALLLMYGIGALVVFGNTLLAVVLTGGVALLLHWKAPLHAFVQRIGEQDLAAFMRLVLLALVVLPVLPDRPMGPYGVLNPFDIWLMVVLIVGIGVASYAVYKLAGEQVGSLLGGVLGGLVSSTATTVSYARPAAAQPEHAALCARVIAIASIVVFARVLVEVSAVHPALLRRLVAPVCVTAAATLLGILLLARRATVPENGAPELDNPAELKPALIFALLYGGILVAVEFVRARFGDVGVYFVAFLGGLTDVDAITLSSARLASQGNLAVDTAWRAVLLAVLANFLMKGGLAVSLGTAVLGRWVVLAFAPPLVVGGLVLLFWPAA